MTTADIRLELRSDPRLLCSVRGLVRGYLANRGMASDRIDDVVLAVDEACANAIRHSYENRGDQKLVLTFRAADGIEIVLQDSGIPAARERLVPREPRPAQAGAVQPGGLGLSFIYRAFDEVTFRPGARRGNRVTMKVRQWT